MQQVQNKTFIISLGGSLFFPDEIDATFVKNFVRIINSSASKGNKFIIVTGGGKIARKYNNALSFVTKPTQSDLDWMGINSTWTNAKFLQLCLGKIAHKDISQDPTKKINFKEKVLVAGGWTPGRSSDGAMVKYAESYKINNLINLTNIDFVYDKDPRKFENAKPFNNLTWDELLKITGKKWIPGANTPFDPIASILAKKNKFKLVITNGRNLENLNNILQGKEYIGTTVN